jgi:hypothetical protein
VPSHQQVRADEYALRLEEVDFVSGGLHQSSRIRPNRLFTADAGIIIAASPNAGSGTYTVVISGHNPVFVDGTFLNVGQTLMTASALQPSTQAPPYGVFAAPGGSQFLISSASLTFSLTGTAVFGSIPGSVSGNLTGTFSVTGTPWPAGGAAVTLSGPISGTYSAGFSQ